MNFKKIQAQLNSMKGSVDVKRSSTNQCIKFYLQNSENAYDLLKKNTFVVPGSKELRYGGKIDDVKNDMESAFQRLAKKINLNYNVNSTAETYQCPDPLVGF